jgi:hypothetical protein
MRPRLVRRGCHDRGGVDFADQVLDRLPTEQHTELVYAIGRAAVAAVPPHERKRRDVVELGARLALPVGRQDTR